MQNPARNSKIGNSETETIFVSHMSEWIFKKNMMERNSVITIFIRIHTLWKILKKYSVSNIKKFSNSRSKHLTSSQGRWSIGVSETKLWMANFPCPPRFRVNWGFLLIFRFASCRTLCAKTGYQSLF